jgi:regulatory protein
MHPRNTNKPRFLRRAGGKSPLAEHQAYDLNHAMDYAVSLLARRDYSTHELKKKLAERGYTEHAYEVVVDDLESWGKVNNERYGQNVVAYRARRGHGPARIRGVLRKSGLSRSAIDEAVKGEEAPDFLALARAIRVRKFGPGIPKDPKERARQARFLQYRGFSNDHIRAAMDGDPEGELEVDDDAPLDSDH